MSARHFEINGVLLLVNVSWRPTREAVQLVGEIIHKNVEKVDWVGVPSASDFVNMLSMITAFEDQLTESPAPIWAQVGAVEIQSWVSAINKTELSDYEKR